MNRSDLFAAATACALATLCSAAWASRPLSVDDASINDKGSGHVEAWFAREAGNANVYYVVPAFSPWEVLELSLPLARDRSNGITSIGALARVRITEPQKSGCNFLVALGHQRFNPGGNQPYAYTAVTCRRNEFALNANLGAAKPQGESSFGTWGLSIERDHGTLVGHVEAFGQEHSKPTFQVGARKDLGKGFQVDGTVGRTDGDTIFSMGVKYSF